MEFLGADDKKKKKRRSSRRSSAASTSVAGSVFSGGTESSVGSDVSSVSSYGSSYDSMSVDGDDDGASSVGGGGIQKLFSNKIYSNYFTEYSRSFYAIFRASEFSSVFDLRTAINW